MSNPMIRIHDMETNEVIDREMTAEEFEDYQKEQTLFLANLKAREEKEAIRAALLDRLGITADEAKLLLQ